jgi:hypothetical protein
MLSRPIGHVLLWLWPFVAMFAISGCLASAFSPIVTAQLVSPAVATPAGDAESTVAIAGCAMSENPQLAYAISTHRLPESYCQDQSVGAPEHGGMPDRAPESGVTVL